MKTIRTLLLLVFFCTSFSFSTQAQVRFFFDDFEKWRGWDGVLFDEFEIDTCLGLGTTDPVTPYSGSRVLGTDLSGIGSNLGNYEPNMASRQCWVTSPPIDCRNYTGVHLKFRRWLNIESVNFDTARIEISNNGGASWNPLWMNGSVDQWESSWSLQDFNISSYADGQASVMIRFSIGGTNSTINRGGWNIDDFEFTGNFFCSATHGSFSDNLEGGTTTYWYQSGLDDFEYVWQTGPTPTLTTGPDAAHSGNYYIYARSSGNLNNTTALNSACLDLTDLANPVLEFYYHMYTGAASDGLGHLYVDIEEDPGSQVWHTIWGKEGNHQNHWIKQVIDLSPYNTGTFRLRFRSVMWWSMYGDVAIDDIVVKDGGAAMSQVSVDNPRVCPGAATPITLDESYSEFNWSLTPGGSIMGTGNSYTTPGLLANTTYYLEKPEPTAFDSLKTTFNGTASNNGIMFNILASNSMVLDSMDVIFTSNAGTQVPVVMYVKNKTYVGYETNTSAWSVHHKDTLNSGGNGVAVKFRFPGIQLNNQDTLGVYFSTMNASYNIRYSNGAMNYNDANMTIVNGAGKAYPFGTTTADKSFNGRIYYTSNSLTTNFTGSNTSTGFMMNFTADEAIAIEGVDVYLDNNASDYGALLYYKKGSYVGFENNASAWVKWDSVKVEKTANFIGRLNLTKDLFIPQGENYSLYIGIVGANLKFSNTSMNNSNKQMTVVSGASVAYPFSTVLSPRSLSTRLHYRVVADSTGIVALQVQVPDISVPNVPDTGICLNEFVTLIVPGATDDYHWYDAASGGNLLGTGNQYTTPTYSTAGNHSFYVDIMDESLVDSLATTTGGTATRGVMFNITAQSEDVMVDALSYYPNSSGKQVVRLYYRNGTYVGNEETPYAWNFYKEFLIPNATVSQRVSLPISGLQIPAGNTLGIYLTGTEKDLICADVSTPTNDTYVQISSGTGIDYPFDLGTSPRSWNGTLYYTIGSDCNSARQEVVVTVGDCFGITESLNAQLVEVYPNPSDGIINLVVQDINGAVEATILDIQGSIVIQQWFNCLGADRYTLDLSKLPKGIYLLKLLGSDLNVAKKIIVE